MTFTNTPDHIVQQVLATEGSCNEVARKFGIAPSTVWRYRKANGVPTGTTERKAHERSAAYSTTNPASIRRRQQRQAQREAELKDLRSDRAKEGAANRISILERARRMAEIDENFIRDNREPVPSRCCSRCKTPYNCGNKGCRCHHA